MASYTYDRLSAQDNTFLIFESPKLHMHVASTLIYEAGPLRTDDGGIDFQRIKRATESYLHRIPRYRQKLHFVPVEGSAVWVDDQHFSIDYHVRHTALPKPGTDEQLKQLASRIMAQPLDRRRPLWETWIVEGLQGDRFAVITKIHHCMIDGSSGVDIAQIMMSMSPDRDIPEAPRFLPREHPSNIELLRNEVSRRLSLPFEAVRDFRQFAAEAESVRSEVGARLKIVGEMLGLAASSSDSPFNGDNGPHRSFDWMNVSLADTKAIRRALDCTINDVVLTTVTSAVRDYLLLRGVSPAAIDFKVSAPVSVRREEEKGQLGNRVSSWILSLPIDEEDPRDQLARIHETTQELKRSNQALGVEMMMRVAEWTPSVLLSLGAQSLNGPVNTIVTNVPGPQFPLYLQGAKLQAIYPQVPLLDSLGMGIALMSYNGRICWGINSDPDIIPDVEEFGDVLAKSFERIAEIAGVELSEGPMRERAAKPKRKSSGNGKTKKGKLRSGSKGESEPAAEIR